MKQAPLQVEKNWDKSLFFPPCRTCTDEEKKLVLSLAVEQGLLAGLENHLYIFNKEVRKQGSGLGIGSDLTRAAARLYLLDWDQLFLQLARENAIKIDMYGRYVDDTGQGMKAIQPGRRWSEQEQRMMFYPHLVEEDLAIPVDQRTMREVVKMGSSIDPMIRLTGDCPSLHSSGMMPLLDTQVLVEGGKVLYEHYRKPVANPLLMLEMSAMPAGMKRTVLTQ